MSHPNAKPTHKALVLCLCILFVLGLLYVSGRDVFFTLLIKDPKQEVMFSGAERSTDLKIHLFKACQLYSVLKVEGD